MHTLRNEIVRIDGLRYVVEQMEFCSSVGHRMLLDSSWMSKKEDLNATFDRVQQYIIYLCDESLHRPMTELLVSLSYLNDIQGSIRQLNAQGKGMTDIDLFELKGLALINERVRELMLEAYLDLLPLPDLSAMLDILDPEGARLPSFYIPDSYDELLGGLRKLFKEASDDEEREKLAIACNEREDIVREKIVKKLYPYQAALTEAQINLALDDMYLAKAKLAMKMRWVRPEIISEGTTHIESMIHPEVASLLRVKGDIFQPVSIRFANKPALITGANMSGKSVLLKTIALIQTLAQYGFYVPAQRAVLVPVDEIILSIGDAQNIHSGLSSFGAEMKCLDYLVKTMRTGKCILAMIDEPARTTNPTEGLGIVNGLITLLAKHKVRAIVSTHYSGIKSDDICCWRVRGFVEERVSLPLEVNNLNCCIDYSLEEDTDGQVPHEAIRIAEIMGIDAELIEECKLFLDKG